jgi:phospholipid N-methyltransferase
MNYLKKIISTGAVRKTPRHIIEQITNEVGSIEGKFVVEAGAGQGEITSALLADNKMDHSSYYAFEIDEEFYRQLNTAFPQITVVNHDAFQFEAVIKPHVSIDYFISSIPLSFYKKTEIENFLNNIAHLLNKDGKFVILYTAFWLTPVFKNVLPGIRIIPFLTFPPYFLGIYTKEDVT